MKCETWKSGGHLAVALIGQDVRGHPVKEPAVVRHDQDAARKVLDGLLQAAQGVHIKVICRLR